MTMAATMNTSSPLSILTHFSAHEVPSVQSLSKGVAAVLATWMISRWISTRNRKYPPGPRGWPLIGNLLDLRGDLWLTFTEWKHVYGPITYLNVAGQPVVVLNTHKAAADLLDRKAAIYSDRPRNIVASEILTGGLLVVFTRYSELWRRMRRAAHEGLNRSVAPSFHPVQTTEAILLTHGLLNEPQAWDNHFRRAAASAVLSIVYDQPPLMDAHDSRVKQINDFVQRLTRAAYPGAHFVEFFTWMKYLPSSIAKWKREAEQWFIRDGAMFKGLYADVERRVNGGDERPSFTATLVKQQDRHGLSMTQAAFLSGTMYAAGAETTSAVLAWFMHAMVLYPEIQRKVQEELDAVVGRSRLPTFADLENMPYIQATVREALRFRPVDPVGLPHRSIEDDVYEGYFIPAGTIVIANVWGLNREPEVYGADADTFNPSRHLDEDGQLAPAPPDTKEEGHVTYGFGRRICVGRHIANNSLFIDIACILWAMNIEPAKDASGKPIMPLVNESINDGLVVRPVPFNVTITPRFPGAEVLVAQAKELQGL